ncbi:MAG: glycosyltransferase family 4 protein [Candidatus Peribacteraceae bacterium]|nr:glycosyltransferase family 4 protein [Candidatus Peribacteraceae bacterium]MDD5075205.1 glycosyltransferase family 4 protein [Candidatus Peribacteraceae bacterium]
MRILLLNDDALPSARGGAAVVVETLRREYARRGHHVTLITTHQDTASGMEERRTDKTGLTISILVRYDLQKRHRHVIGRPYFAEHLRALIRECQPDVIHAHNVHTYLTYESLRIAREFTPRIFLTAHDTFLVSFQRVNQKEYLSAALKNEPFHMHFWHHALSAGRKYWPFRNAMIHRIIRQTGTTVISISRALQTFLRINGIESNTVIYNGVPASSPPPQDLTGKLKEQWGLRGPTLLYGGRINADKGLLAVLSAWKLVIKKLPEAHLLIVGRVDGDFLSQEKYAPIRKSLCLPGWIPYEDMPLTYAVADAVTTPSLYLDAFNLMNIEAMAAGKPVIGSIFGGIPEIVSDGKTGFVIHPDDPTAFAHAILTILQNPDLARHMGEAGRRKTLEEFSVERCADRYLSLFHDQSAETEL